MNDSDFMGLAYEQAKIAYSMNEVPVGAVIVRDNQVIASGYNHRETNKDATGHAEIEAIRSACFALNRWQLSGCTLYVTLEPCMMCMGACSLARLDRIVIGALDPKGGWSLSHGLQEQDSGLHHHPSITSGIDEERCSALLKTFFKEKRKMKVSVQRAITGESIAQCLEIRNIVFIQEQNVPFDLEVDNYDTPQSSALHYLAFIQGKPVATCRVLPYGATAYKVGRVAVLKEMRGQGIGFQMMRGIETSLRELGAQTLVLEAQLHALGFYEKLDYNAEGPIFMDAGIQHRKMTKQLK